MDTIQMTYPVQDDALQLHRLQRHNRAMRRLVEAVQELSLARSLNAVTEVVRRAARQLTGADGATFVVREGDNCLYADEEAISPLWKGQRFPMSACISGWVMLNRQSAIIEDIYQDPRIPVDAYRPTFVKSLVMVPIRVDAPVGAIGNYWARPHRPDPEEVELLQTLANTASVALEDVQLFAELEKRVRDRTVELQAANQELEAFSYSVSHDLRAPLRSIASFSEILAQDFGEAIGEEGRQHLARVQKNARHMGELIEGMLVLSRVTRAELDPASVDLSALAHDVVRELCESDPTRHVHFEIHEGLTAMGDRVLLRAVLANLLGNAWKFTSKRGDAQVRFGQMEGESGRTVFFVKDNGAGFDMAYAQKLFGTFQRMHRQEEFPGSGIGLATVRRIITKHGGRIWAEAKPNEGATFFFTLQS